MAQILSAATYPDQIAVANNWLQQNKNLTGTALGQAVDKQSWDPSVKALTQFPSVLNNLAKNLSWTSQLGEAYHNQQADVMTAIQTLRAQAKAAGNLKSGSQNTVVQQAPQTSSSSRPIPRLSMFRNTTRPWSMARPTSFPGTVPRTWWRPACSPSERESPSAQ